MAILEKEILISINNRNVRHYEDLGYDIPRVEGKKGRMKIEKETHILVSIGDLSNGSHVPVTKICDICGKHAKNQRYHQVLCSREQGDGLDRCKECAYLVTGDRMRKNMKYEDSLKAYAIKNKKEYLLEEYSMKNIHDASKIKPFSIIECIWNCFVCESEYKDRPQVRCGSNTGCPYCAGKRVNNTNSLASLRLDLAREWHIVLNGDLTPHDVTTGSNKKVWWLGKCEHKWKTSISHRTRENQETGCPYCAGQKILIGFNDMWTTNPELASMLADPEDGYKYTQGSDRLVNWKCPHCQTSIKRKRIYDIYRSGLSCPFCSDGISIPEKIMSNVLRSLNIEFKWQKTFSWLPSRRYDFYLLDFDTIIEVHGGQHYIEGFVSVGGQALKEVEENDKLKKNMAIEKEVSNYIVIDARASTVDWIKNSILSSDLNSLFDFSLVDWEAIELKSLTSLMLETCDLWNKGTGIEDIAREIGLSTTTIRSYLNRGTQARLCTFTGHNVEIVQLSLEGDFIGEWESMIKASRHFGHSNGVSISECCRGKRNDANGYKWMRKADYQKIDKI